MDRLTKPKVVGERLGLSPKDVRHLARLGLLKGKMIVVRGMNKKPRMMILESSIERYIAGLPDAQLAPSPHIKPRPKRLPRRTPFPGLIEFV